MKTENPSGDAGALAGLRFAFEQFNSLSARLSASYDAISAQADRIVTPAGGAGAERHGPLFDAIPGAVVLLDRHGRVDAANLAARELLGEPLTGEPWREVVRRAFLPELDQGELKTGDGRQFSIATRPLGYVPGQVLLLSEVTRTRDLQRAAQQNLHLVTMGKMMASLAHQIRTPLASLMLYLSQCAETGLDEASLRGFSGKALERSRHIEKLINDMLVFAHGGQFVTARFGVGELLDELREQLEPHLEHRGARLHIDGGDCGAELQGNKDALLGALANLCVNALQASAEQPRIAIRVAPTRRGMLSISVRDNGCGMDRQTRAHIFDPFFSTKTDGTGLGLAVVKAVVESHQGRVAVHSRPGRGCRFRLFLPSRGALRTQIS